MSALDAGNTDPSQYEDVPDSASYFIATGELNEAFLGYMEQGGLLESGARHDSPEATTSPLKSRGQSNKLFVNLDLDQAAEHLAIDASSNLILLYQPAIDRLTCAIANGVSLHAAISECINHIEKVLSIYRRNRRRIILMDAHAVSANPAGALAKIENRTSIPVKKYPKAQSDRNPEGNEKLANIIASSILQEDHSLKQLVKELEAGNCLPSKKEAALSEKLLDFRDELAAVTLKANNSKEENELSLLQLRQIKDERDVCSAWNQELEKMLESSRSMVSAMKQSLSWKLTAPLRRALDLFLPNKG